MFVFGTFGTCGTFGTFGTCLALDCSEHLANIDQNQSRICQNQPKTPKVNMLKSGDVSFDFGFEWCLGLATGYVAKMLILATYPSANSPSWPPCPGTFGTLFGTFGTFGTSGTFGTFLDPGNIVRVQHSRGLRPCRVPPLGYKIDVAICLQ